MPFPPNTQRRGWKFFNRRSGRVGRVAATLASLSAAVGLVALPGHPAAAASTVNWPGYWMITSNGGLLSFGGVTMYGNGTSDPSTSVAVVPSADGAGYWIAHADGTVTALGDAPALGNTPVPPARPIVGMAATPDGKGYWLVGADGGIFSFGDAAFHGSTGGMHLNQPVVGMASTADGNGYWLVASDGGIFSFGDAAFHGSTGGMRLNKPVVGMAPSPSGGYWLTASDGGIFTFGGAPFFGSTGSIRLNRPITAMVPTKDGNGYWLVASDGGVFTYGNAPFRGSAGSSAVGSPVVGIASGPGVGTDVTPDPASGVDPYPSGAVGYDISWPQCGGGYPARSAVAVIGVNDGRAFSTNPCLASQAAWAGQAISVYINLNSPNGSSYNQGATGPAGTCASSNANCWSYNYGVGAARSSEASAQAAGIDASMWWLDVESGNYWSGNQAANAQVVQGAIDALHSDGHDVGIYSTGYQFGNIAGGGYKPGVPTWQATGVGMGGAAGWCSPNGFTGGPVWLVQGGLNGFDGDYAC